MAELLTFVRRRSKKKDSAGYSLLSAQDEEAEVEESKLVEDKENVIPSVKGGRAKKATVKSSNPDEMERRRSSWIGRMLSYSSSTGAGGILEEQSNGKKKTNKKNANKKKSSSSGGSYTRRAMPANAAEKKQKAFQQYLQDMKSYFSQVDAYELVEESPSPAKREVLESSHAGNDLSYSSKRGGSNRRSSIVIRRESIQEYNTTAKAARLSCAFDKLTTLDTLAEETEDVPREKEGKASSSSSGLQTQEENENENENENEIASAEDKTLVDTLDTIIEDLDLISENDEEKNSSAIGYHLKQLLSECSQSAAKLQDIPSLDEFIQSQCPEGSESVFIRKVGEGTFGEAFKLSNNLVLKVVPIDGDVLVNGEKQKTNEELYAEVVIHNCLKRLRSANGASSATTTTTTTSSSRDNLCDSFIETHGIAVCQGKYAPCLVDAWERWDKCNTSENDHVGMFQSDQLYIVFAYSDGGEDLESFKFRTFDEIRSMLMQVTMGLAVAEEELKFEHRDLHWGNILLRRTPRSALSLTTSNEASAQYEKKNDDDKLRYVLRGVPIQVETSGLQAQMIDFTLSRLEAKTSSSSSAEQRENSKQDTFVAFCDLSLDEWLFKGPKGDIQAETYRKMLKRVDKHSQGNWAEFHAQNNVYWLTYLVDCVMMNKLRSNDDDDIGALSLTSEQNRQLRQFRKACMSASTESCHDLVWHDLFKDCWKITN